jgi:hypothetical protein
VPNTFITGLAPPPTTHEEKPSPALLYSGGIVEAVHDPNGLFLPKSLFMSGRERVAKIDQGYPQRRTFLFDALYEAYTYPLARRGRRWLPLKWLLQAL